MQKIMQTETQLKLKQKQIYLFRIDFMSLYEWLNYLFFGSPKVNFGPLMGQKSYSANVDHCTVTNLTQS